MAHPNPLPRHMRFHSKHRKLRASHWFSLMHQAADNAPDQVPLDSKPRESEEENVIQLEFPQAKRTEPPLDHQRAWERAKEASDERFRNFQNGVHE